MGVPGIVTRTVVLALIIRAIRALILPCNFYEGRETTERSTCCVMRGNYSADAEDIFYCLPRFMIMGTQKSGTTALAGLLSQHPVVIFPSSKEVHFFDKNTSKSGTASPLTVLSYMKHFSINETDAAIATGESLPIPAHEANIELTPTDSDELVGTSTDSDELVGTSADTSEKLTVTVEGAGKLGMSTAPQPTDSDSSTGSRRRRTRRRGHRAGVINTAVEKIRFGDATPFYIASRLSCQRISNMISSARAVAAPLANTVDGNDTPSAADEEAGGSGGGGQSLSETLSAPSMKFIVILRDPVERLYSEYHMKHRRVEDQDSFLRALNSFGGDVQRCLRQFEAKYLCNGSCAQGDKLPLPQLSKSAEFLECLPLPIMLSKSFPRTRFLQELDKLYKYNASISFADKACNSDGDLVCPDEGRTRIYSSSSSAGHDRRGFAFASMTELLPSEYCFGTAPEGSAPNATSQDTRADAATGTGVAPNDELTAHLAEMSALGIDVEGPTHVPSPPSVFLHRKKCNLKFGNEHVGASIETVLSEELDSLVSCGGDDILTGNISSVDAVISKCMRVKKGIADQYLYRSMYAVQLHHCWKSLDRSAFLILRADDLKSHQEDTLNKVFSFLGVHNIAPKAPKKASGSVAVCTSGTCPDEDDLAAAVDAAVVGRSGRHESHANHIENDIDLQARISRSFPEFAATSGWRLHSSYPPLPASLREHLHETLFKHHEQLLDELLTD